MPKKASGGVTFHHHVRPEGDHRLRILTIENRARIAVAGGLRNARDEADRLRFRDLQYWGIDYHFDPVPSGGAVQISWLEYLDGGGAWVAAAPDIDTGDRYSELQRGLDLLVRIGDVIQRYDGHPNRVPTDATFEKPSKVIDALRNSRKFVEVERFEVDRRGYWLEAVPGLSEEVA